MTVAGSTDRPFVGRVAERESLAAHIVAARGGSGRVVLVRGESGVGKTRLVEESVTAVAPASVLWGRCQEMEGAPAFWPWVQALRTYALATPPERLRAALGDDAPLIARLVPAVATRCPGVSAASEETLDPEAARFRLFDAVTMFLRAVVGTELLVVVLDDLHWADNESLLLLAFVARELRDQRLLVLGTYRETELRQAAAAARVLGDLARSSHRLTLSGLTGDDVAQYVLAACGRAPAPETVEAILRATEGNAFFVTEVVQLLLARGQLDASAVRSSSLDLPAGVQEVIRRRIEPLSAETRRVLGAAAVIGREFEIGVLARIVALPADAVFFELASAVHLGAIEEVAERPGAFRFSHALLQETLATDLGSTVRAELHRAAGAALEAVHGEALDPVLGDIARHYFEAAPLGTLPQAIEFATRAGQHAFAQLGYEEAAGHFERALQASRGAAVSPDTRLSILLPLGTAQQAAGDAEGARATLIEAAQLARDLGYGHIFPLALTLAPGVETGTVDWTLIRLLEEAVELVGSRDGHRRTILLAQLARSLYFADATRRHAYSEEALTIARRRDDDVGLLAALRARQLALWEPGEAMQRRDIGREILELAGRVRDPLLLGEALGWHILDHLELADMPAVHDGLRRYRELAAVCRLPSVRWHVTVVEGTLAQLAGRLDDARRLARRALGLLTPSLHNNVAMFFGVQSFMIRAEEGRLGEIEPFVKLAAERGTTLPIWHTAHALVHIALGRMEAAHEVLADLAKGGFRDLPRDGNLLGTYANLAMICTLLDAPRFAGPLAPLLAPHADSVVILATTVGCLGSTARYAGLLAHVLGELDPAIAHFEAALATNERIGALPLLAHTQHELARSLRARGKRGDRERAAKLDAEAAETAARLGLVALQHDLAAGDTAPRATVQVPPGPAPGSAQRTARLSHEGDVWTVACDGELTRLKDSKGLAYLLQLLRHPGHEFHALDLGGAENLRAGDAGEMLDADARRAYKARLGELRDELQEAEELNDIGRAARLREEMEMLADELSRASGLGGRSRKAGSDAERARLNVTRAVRKVVRKIEAGCPLLGRHLDRSVQTGLFCAYQPDPTYPIEWEL
jgi:tetratricopeptide (TPR) repeat protein